MNDKVLTSDVVTYVVSRMKMVCMWSSWCHCHPIISCCVKIQSDL